MRPLLSTLAAAALLSSALPLSAAGTTKSAAGAAKSTAAHLTDAEAHRGAEALKTLPRLVREAFIAEKLGLLFKPDGSPAYSGALSSTKGNNQHYFIVYEGAQFVSSEGELHDYHAEMAKLTSKKHNTALDKVKKAIASAGEDAVFSAFSKEKDALCLHTAQYWLDSLPAPLREAILADTAGLLFRADGTEVYKGEISSTINGSTRPFIIRQMANKVRFIDSEGTEQDYSAIIRKSDANKAYLRARQLISWCVQLSESEALLALYADTLSAMKQHAQERE